MRFHAGRRAAMVAALALMAGAGQWLRVSADVPQVAANTWASAGNFGATPEGSAAAPLTDGRIVVAGGHYSDGTLVSQIGIYNPASQSWEDGGQLGVARTGHTVTALDDGRVLIAGGRTVNGPSFDVEIYNPNTRQSVHAGDLWVPRVNHAAVELGSGLVLVAGGSNGSGFLDYLELFDSTSGQTESLSIRLGVAREKLTATRLLDGHVLIAGGRNENGNLPTAEIFVSGSRSIFETGSLRTARSGHAAVLLPNNNQVLIAGGTVNGAPAASAELYADWRDGFRVVPNSMSHARTGAVAGALPHHNLGFVGGGGSTSGEYFGYATVKTDRADYWPGETVTITGSGWQPGETVTLKISEDADTHYDFTYTAVADAHGNIINTDFAPIENEVFHHFGMRFYLAATGAASTALNTFTDGNSTISGTVRQSGTNAPIQNATVTCTGGCDDPASTTTNAAGFYSFKVPFPGNGTATITLSASATDYENQTLPSFQTAHQQVVLNKDFLLEPNVRPTSTAVNCVANPIAVNASTTCTATVSDTGTGTTTVPAGSVAFASNGSGDFDDASCTLTGSPASCAVVYTPTARGTGTHAITGSYTATSRHTNSSNVASPFNLTVNKAPQATLNLTTPANLVYGTSGTASVTGGSGDGAVTFSAGSSTGCSVNATTGVITVTNASGNCAISAEKAADDNYLVATAGPKTVALEKADAEVAVTGFNGTYDAQPHGATGTATGVGGADLSGQLDLGAKFTNFPGGTANWTFEGGDNYADESGSVNIVIGKADAIVSVNGYTGTYDAQPHGATGTATGVGGVPLPGLNLGGSFTNAPGGTAYWTFSGGTNYLDESGNVQIVINKANATVSVNGYTGTYDGLEHGATGSATGVGGADLSGQLNLGAKFTNVPGGTANWTFTGGTNYNDDSGSVQIVINKANATISVNGYTDTYDGNAHGATGTATGVNGVDLSAGFNFGQQFTDVPGGTANWTFEGGTNYNDADGSVAIVINKADATVVVDGYSGTYDGNAHGATGSAKGIGGVALPGLDLGDSFTNVPGGTASWTFNGGTNYNNQNGTASIVIDPKPASVKAHNKTKTYGDPNPELTAVEEDVVYGETLNYSLSTTAGQFAGIGPYPITVTLGNNPNYVVTPIHATLTIGTRPATITANNKEKPYNTDNPALDATVTGTVNNDVLSYSLATTATKTSDVGVYPIVVTVGSNPNYAVVPTNGTLTIVQAAQTITFPAIGPKNYGDVFTVSANAISGLAVTFAASGSCSVAGAVVTVNSVGSCTVTASQAGNHNYLAAPNVPQTFGATYNWSGVLQPINQDGSSIFKLGSTIPVKFRLTGASASITNLAAKIYVAKISNGVAGYEYEALTNANADSGNQFRYDPSGELYIYNWGTKLSGGGLAASEGTWQIRIDLLDGNLNNTVIVTLKK